MRKIITLVSAVAVGILAYSFCAFADNQSGVRQYPGWNGAGPDLNSPISGWVSNECWEDYNDDDDDDDDGPGYTFTPGWSYTPAGWWYRKSDGTWPANTWDLIDFRWYRFNQDGHIVTGWFTDGDGYKYYLNPVDDGTLGSVRTGWQMIDGKAYYFGTSYNDKLGHLYVNTTTPDGYKVGADGALVQ